MLQRNGSSTTAWRASLGRSVRLWREFRHERTHPERFYTAIAEDSAAQLSQYVALAGCTVLDVGGGPGYFRSAFVAAGASYVALDVEVSDHAGTGEASSRMVVGSGMQLPFASNSMDIAYSSNVLEHVDDPWRMAEEMLRVTKPGGITFLAYTVWHGPWGGHETSPWHYLGGSYARRRYTRRHGHEPKNKFGESLFAVSVRDGLQWSAAQEHGDLLEALPRYNPRWSYWMVRVPVLRELATWNLVLVLRKRGER